MTGDTLTAADLNNSFSNIINDYNGSVNSSNVGTLTNTLTLTVATNNVALNTTSSSTTTNSMKITSDSLTTGSALSISSNSADTTARFLVDVVNSNAAATGAITLRIRQTSTGNSMVIGSGSTVHAAWDSNGSLIAGGANAANWINNISIVAATTTNANDSVKITSSNGTALSTTNPGWITLPSTVTAGQLVKFEVTADVTILISGATWVIDGNGNVTGALLRVLADNDNGTLRWCVAYVGGRNTLLAADTTATQASVTAPEYVLCNVAVGSASNTCKEVGWVRANFTDSTNVWAIQSGLNDVNTGTTADGYWQPYNPVWGGFAVNPTFLTTRWTQIGRNINVLVTLTAGGTSNATTLTITSPVKANLVNFTSLASYQDNTATVQLGEGIVQTRVGSQTMDCFTSTGSGPWTNVNTKYAEFFTEFEVGPAASFIE